MSKTEGEDKKKAGRPLKFSNVEELEAKIQEYFKSCEERWEDQFDYVPQKDAKGKDKVKNGRVLYHEVLRKVKRPAIVPTITGLAVALDTSRQTLIDYGTDEHFESVTEINEETKRRLIDTIKRAKDAIHACTEALLTSGLPPAGVIFSLKNNYGWKDKSEQDIDLNARVEGYILETKIIPSAGSTDAATD